MAISLESMKRVDPIACSTRTSPTTSRRSAAEGLVRNLPTFLDFLDVAALSDGEIVNFSNIARECGVSSHTTKSHFQILEDTLLGRWLPAYQKRPKRRVISSPKFYFVVVNRLARRVITRI